MTTAADLERENNYRARPCFYCRSKGWCEHRESELACDYNPECEWAKRVNYLISIGLGHVNQTDITPEMIAAAERGEAPADAEAERPQELLRLPPGARLPRLRPERRRQSGPPHKVLMDQHAAAMRARRGA
jgi:hypothetical protein